MSYPAIKVNIDGTPQDVANAVDKLEKQVLGSSISNFMGIVGNLVGIGLDRTMLWRMSNYINTLEKAQFLANKHGISLHELAKNLPWAKKFIVHACEASSKEETDELQILWARLMVGTLSQGQDDVIFFVDVVEKLSPNDVMTLDLLYKNSEQDIHQDHVFPIKTFQEMEKNTIVSLAKLQSQKLIEVFFHDAGYFSLPSGSRPNKITFNDAIFPKNAGDLKFQILPLGNRLRELLKYKI